LEDQEKKIKEKLNRLGESLINQLFMLIRTLKIHQIDNEAFSRPLESLRDTINRIIDISGDARIIGVGKDVYLNGLRIRVKYRNIDCASFLVEQLAGKDIGDLTFTKHIEVPQLKQFLVMFSRQAKDDTTAKQTSKLPGISIGTYRKLVDDLGGGQHLLDKKKYALRVYTRAIITLKAHVEALKRGENGLPGRKLQRVIQEICDIASGETNLLIGLASITPPLEEDQLYYHSVNVVLLSAGLAQRLDLPRQEVAEIALAAYLHDTGMAYIPREAINKSGELTPEERVKVSRHVLQSLRNLIKSGMLENLRIMPLIVAYEHHLRYDGKDRPPGATPVNSVSQIVSLADSYCALTSDKSWRKAYRPDEALRIMLSEAGKKFDPLLLKAFINLVGIYPIGTVVTLDTGEIAMIFMNTDQPDRPVVKLLLTSDWKKPGPLRHYDLSEIDETGEYVRSIVGAISAEEFGINVAKALLD